MKFSYDSIRHDREHLEAVNGALWSMTRAYLPAFARSLRVAYIAVILALHRNIPLTVM